MCNCFLSHTENFIFDPEVIPLILTENPWLVMEKYTKV